MSLKQRIGGLFDKGLKRFHNHPLNISSVYRELATKAFMEKAVADRAVLFWDYDDYLHHNAKLFDSCVSALGIDKRDALCMEFGVFKGYSINVLSKALPDYRFLASTVSKASGR